MRRIFWRERSPRSTVTARRGRPSSSARNSQSAAVARPSTGGAWTLTFRASPSQPHTTLRGALGMALMARVQEAGADAEGTEWWITDGHG